MEVRWKGYRRIRIRRELKGNRRAKMKEFKRRRRKKRRRKRKNKKKRSILARSRRKRNNRRTKTMSVKKEINERERITNF